MARTAVTEGPAPPVPLVLNGISAQTMDRVCALKPVARATDA
jgi:hypothetical protein